jgi:haloacetate dehalogenase
MFEGFKRIAVQTPGATIDCVIAGQGPGLLLLHGFPQTKALWSRIAPQLTGSYSVVAMDLRGYGDSSKPEAASDGSTYSFRAMGEDALAVMTALGFETFHVVGHDRGARTAYRLALDHPKRVASLSVLDIAPTYSMLMNTNRHIAGAYWHWYFLSQPAPFPEHFIGLDPDRFFETSLLGWGRARLEDFDAAQLAEYRRCWRDKDTIRGMCADYRSAVSADLAHDTADHGRVVECPALAFWGTEGVMHQVFDLGAEWRARCRNLKIETLPGGHFFLDQFPDETARILKSFLAQAG